MISSYLMPNSLDRAEVPAVESDPMIARQVRVELRRSGYAEMRRVEVSLEGDVLTLSGVVYSFHMKQLAQEIVRKAAVKVTIKNRLQVVSAPKQSPK